jgi:hypothetical protein
MSVTAGGDAWSPAVNLGAAINTPRNELSPFVNPGDGKFLFASDGHLGLGGLDLYGVTRQPAPRPKSPTWDRPSTPTATIFPGDGHAKGYLASNRAGGPGGFDLYTFDNFSRSAVWRASTARTAGKRRVSTTSRSSTSNTCPTKTNCRWTASRPARKPARCTSRNCP